MEVVTITPILHWTNHSQKIAFHQAPSLHLPQTHPNAEIDNSQGIPKCQLLSDHGHGEESPHYI